MKLLLKQDYLAQPWKNGFGTTREISNKYLGDKLVWRLSVAEVTSDGPFSFFKGYERILTVISGDGMRLIGDRMGLQADRLRPLHFSGSDTIMGHCICGPVENLNLIYDPLLVDAEVLVTSTLGNQDCMRGSDTVAVYVLSGHLRMLDGRYLNSGDTCLYSNEPVPFYIEENQQYICVTLRNR